MLAVSRDGWHVYFVANGALAPGAHPGDCTFTGDDTPESGFCNLYVYERDEQYPDGHISLVASLSGADASRNSFGGGGEANVTSDGRFLVFEARDDLTPDDTVLRPRGRSFATTPTPRAPNKQRRYLN